ncbi:hypothetical protein KY284_032888 [Solanum tuberosum]|nr:hypothetical protein KY284_032888 [Solanum tuberosum]
MVPRGEGALENNGTSRWGDRGPRETMMPHGGEKGGASRGCGTSVMTVPQAGGGCPRGTTMPRGLVVPRGTTVPRVRGVPLGTTVPRGEEWDALGNDGALGRGTSGNEGASRRVGGGPRETTVPRGGCEGGAVGPRGTTVPRCGWRVLRVRRCLEAGGLEGVPGNNCASRLVGGRGPRVTTVPRDG